MKNLLLAITVFIFSVANAQNKELTLEEAVLSYSKGLTPKTLSSLRWIDGTTNYIYKQENTYIIKNINGKTIQIIGGELLKIRR